MQPEPHQRPLRLQRLLVRQLRVGAPGLPKSYGSLELRVDQQLQMIDASRPGAEAIVTQVPLVGFSERPSERDEVDVILVVHLLVEALQDPPVAGATEEAAAAVEDREPGLLLPAAQGGMRCSRRIHLRRG